jgi:drug/metabolite transporter (DMT)-like permease
MATPSSRLAPGLALAAIGAVAFSGKAIIVKLAYRWGVDAVTLIMLRMLFALPIFAVMAWWSSRGKPALSGRDWAGVIGLGVTGYYLSSYLDFLGLQYVSAALERLILYLNPTLVLLIGWVLHRKTVTRQHLVAMGVSYAGTVAVFGHEIGAMGPQAAWGAALVFGSALSYAAYLVYSAQLVQRLGSVRLVGLATSVACVCCVLQFVVLRPVGSVLQVATPVVWLSVANAVFCTAVPVLLVMMAVERIGPSATAQTGMIGPLSTILMGVLILGEAFTGWVAVGTALVIAVIYLFTRPPRPAPARGTVRRALD